MEIAIISKAKQGYIYNYLKANNMTLAELATHIGISYSKMCNVINFQWLPPKRRKIGDLSGKLENYFHIPIEMLFPPELTPAIAERLGRKVVQIQDVEFLCLEDTHPKYLSYEPRDNDDEEHLIMKLYEQLNTLRPHEEKCLRLIYGIGTQ